MRVPIGARSRSCEKQTCERRFVWRWRRVRRTPDHLRWRNAGLHPRNATLSKHHQRYRHQHRLMMHLASLLSWWPRTQGAEFPASMRPQCLHHRLRIAVKRCWMMIHDTIRLRAPGTKTRALCQTKAKAKTEGMAQACIVNRVWVQARAQAQAQPRA